MCEKTKTRYSCGCDAMIIEWCAFVVNNPTLPCPNVRYFNGTDEDICPSCQDKYEKKQREEQMKTDKRRGRNGEQPNREEEERGRELVRAQAFNAGYNNARLPHDVTAGSATAADDVNTAEMQYAQSVVEETSAWGEVGAAASAKA